jgi:hypothetical protein
VRVRVGLTGSPLAQVQVRFADGAGRTVASTFVPLDGQGIGEAPTVPEGIYSVFFGGPQYAPTRVDGVAVPGPSVTAALMPGGTLIVESSAERLARGGAACRFTGPGGQPLAWNAYGTTEMRFSAPTAELKHFPAVAGALVCDRSSPVPFSVPEGGTARVVLK